MIPEDVAGLAARIREAVGSAARSRLEPAATVEARFLRRLCGALSAYEAARGILSPADPPPGPPGSSPAPLTRQACPGCGETGFDAVSDGWTVRVVCRQCRNCWLPAGRSLALTNPDQCPGCELSDHCANRSTTNDARHQG